ncbi:hypothetical protein JXA80_10560 [bacterium]|nr:hypothetical protein [candidate division CSSED10-310 bacterium]
MIVILLFTMAFSEHRVIAFEFEWEHPLPSGSGLYALDFADDMNGWAVGHFSSVLRTSDGGNTWVDLTQMTCHISMMSNTLDRTV